MTLIGTVNVDPLVGQPRPDEPAEPPPGPPPAQPPGDDRSPRQRWANWMESTFGPAYLPLTMGAGGVLAGGAAFVVLDRLTPAPRLLSGIAAIVAGVAGAGFAGALVFSD